MKFTERRQQDAIKTTTKQFSRQNTSHVEQQETAKHSYNNTTTTDRFGTYNQANTDYNYTLIHAEQQ